MDNDSRRRTTIIALIVVVIAIVALLLLLSRCRPQETPTHTPSPDASQAPLPQAASEAPSGPAPQQPASEPAEERLTPATLTVPAQVIAGAAITVNWTGPDNPGDHIIIVRADAPDSATGRFQETQHGPSLELPAPEEPGPHEARYITGRSRTVLGRASIDVVAAAATLDAPAEVVLGSAFSVAWTGPGNDGDYITIVASDAPDAHYGSYADADKGSPITLTAPTETGQAEVRYVTAQAKKVLARRAIRIVMPEVTLNAAEEAVAGSTIEIAWVGPNNAGDYITIVAAGTNDGQYGNYANTSAGAPLKLLVPILDGPAELRYMSGQGHKVLARRAIAIKAAVVTLSAAPECAAGADVAISWTGPNHGGDYITIVPKGAPDGQYAAYANTTGGSPLMVKAPMDAGDAEIRYMTGQGNKVLARIAIKIVP